MRKENNTRRFPGESNPRPDLGKLKKEEAAQRKAEYCELSLADKIAKLDLKLGRGVGAVKQRTRLNALLVQSQAPSVEEQVLQLNERPQQEKKHLKAKERRAKEQKE